MLNQRFTKFIEAEVQFFEFSKFDIFYKFQWGFANFFIDFIQIDVAIEDFKSF